MATKDTNAWEPLVTKVMDQDHNGIYDSLDARLALVNDTDPVPVIVMAKHQSDLDVLAQAAAISWVKYRYKVIPALAATLTKAQIRLLSQQSGLHHVEYDDQVHALMDGASRWFGITKARADFGLTGNRDGAQTYSKNDIVIAVVDTGIDATHVDLSGKVIGWQDFIGSKATPYDDNGHGTHVSGTAAGAGVGNPAYIGVAPGAALVGVKVLDQYGSGTLSGVVAGVDWVVQHKDEYNIKVLSMSLGTNGSSDGTDTVSQAVNRAADAGIVPVIAAGNSGPGRFTVGAPGAADKAITVAAMADVQELGFGLAAFSSRGPTQDGRMKPDIAGPGVEIMAPLAGSKNQYVSYSGTSMATPFVAGTVALMLDANPQLSPASLKEILHRTALDWGPPGPDEDYGWGRLDGYEAVRQAGNLRGTGPAVPGHLYVAGTLAKQGDVGEHTFTISDPSYPINVTMIMPDWNGRTSPDYDLWVFKPDGEEFDRSAGTVRQEQVGKAAAGPGTYKVQVKSYLGAGRYYLDISGGVSVDAPPTVTFEQPAEGATVSGSVVVKVRATDDIRLAKVELAVDGGAYTEITGSFDGTFFTYPWDTTTAGNGAHALTARATDSGSQMGVSTRNVMVDNPVTASHDVVRQGQVTAQAKTADVRVNVLATGYMELVLAWSTTADLDFDVWAPDGTYVGRAFTLNNPERMRVDTAKYGAGTYRIRISLYKGADSAFTLSAEGFRRQEYTGNVTATAPNVSQAITVPYTGRGRFVLRWPTTADLDFYVNDPSGKERARAFTLLNPEQSDVVLDPAGSWSVRVNLYKGPDSSYTLTGFIPDAVLG